MSRSMWILAFALVTCRPARGADAVDPDTNAQNIKDNAVGGTELDKFLGHVSVHSRELLCLAATQDQTLPGSQIIHFPSPVGHLSTGDSPLHWLWCPQSQRPYSDISALRRGSAACERFGIRERISPAVSA